MLLFWFILTLDFIVLIILTLDFIVLVYTHIRFYCFGLYCKLLVVNQNEWSLKLRMC